MNTGQANGRAANLNLAGAPTTLPRPLPSPPAIGPAAVEGGVQGALLAWDIAAQKERWRAPAGGGAGGGTVTTAGNLVIQVVPDGRLIAYTADRGNKLLEVQTGLRGGMGPPITYLLDGRQYIAFAGGTGGRGNTQVPNRETEQGVRGPTPAPLVAGGSQVTPKLLVFVLDGRAALPVASGH